MLPQLIQDRGICILQVGGRQGQEEAVSDGQYVNIYFELIQHCGRATVRLTGRPQAQPITPW